MEILRVAPGRLTQRQLRAVTQILHNGGSIVYPTDTTYGIGCDATNPDAVKNVFAIKHRPADKQMSVMVSGISMARRCCQWNARAQSLASQWWPGALTIVLKQKIGRGTVGVRMPNHDLALQIAKAYHKPIITTSANISGESPCYSIPSFLSQVKRQRSTALPDLLINAGSLPRRQPSTVVDVRKHPKIIRNGSVRIVI
ncbi:threonylcarbamoyl-AMP synthase [Candidatus Uhrbacteria bacterium]|nr:threonylcarbamoyl-AMP synthase [Candidatus Uhrbacteria bacterium]